MRGYTVKRTCGVVAAALVVTVMAAGCIPATTAAPAAKAPTVAAPSPPAGPRDLATWPFAASSPWNMPLGTGAAYDSRQIVSTTTSTPWINSATYSVPVVRASASDPVVTINVSGGTFPGPVSLHLPPSARPAAGGDAHLAVISPDGLHANEFWALDLGSRTAGVSIPVDLTGAGVGIGWVRATGVSLLGGLIRSSEVTGIPHALAMSLPYNLLGDGHVWPAVSNDDGGAPASTPQGSLLAIPTGTLRPTGLSPLGNAIFDALAHYGAYIVDQTGGGAAVFYAEPTMDPATVSAAVTDMNKVMPLLRRITNNTPATTGGPGTRLVATAP